METNSASVCTKASLPVSGEKGYPDPWEININNPKCLTGGQTWGKSGSGCRPLSSEPQEKRGKERLRREIGREKIIESRVARGVLSGGAQQMRPTTRREAVPEGKKRREILQRKSGLIRFLQTKTKSGHDGGGFIREGRT